MDDCLALLFSIDRMLVEVTCRHSNFYRVCTAYQAYRIEAEVVTEVDDIVV
jgi:hypothetical protein